MSQKEGLYHRRASSYDPDAAKWSHTVYSLVMEKYRDKFTKLQHRLAERQEKFYQTRQRKLRNSWICTKQAPMSPQDYKQNV